MRNDSGFTLIELMIVVVIIGILLAIAVPNYTAYVRRGKIAEPISNLSSLRVRAEQYFQDNRTYVGFPLCPGTAAFTAWRDANAKNFAYTCPVAPSAIAYAFQADGLAARNMAGFTYAIDQDNTKSSAVAATGPADWVGTQTACWITRPGPLC